MRLKLDKLELLSIINGSLLQENEQELEISNISIDTRSINHGSSTCFFAIETTKGNGHQYISQAVEKGVQLIVVSKSFEASDGTLPANCTIIGVEDTLSALQKLARVHREKFTGLVIGVTGSNGKTIVKDWLAHFIEQEGAVIKSPKSFNSQVGVPLSTLLLENYAEFAVLEAGISQPGEMEKLEKIISPKIGVLTNIKEAHQENFQTRQHKIEEKLLLFTNCDTIIYQKDDVLVNDCIQQRYASERLFTWSYDDEKANLNVQSIASEKNATTLNLLCKGVYFSVQIPFADAASVENALSCISTLCAINYPLPKIKSAAESLAPVEMRLELRNGINNSSIINDYYNSDISSLEIALEFLDQQTTTDKKCLILSDLQQTGWSNDQIIKEINGLLKNRALFEVICIGPILSKSKSIHGENVKYFNSTDQYIKSLEPSSFSNSCVLIKGARSFRFERIAKKLQKRNHDSSLEINLSKIQHNLDFFRNKIAPSTKIMAMVKALSYGSGPHELAKLLEFNNIDYLGVAYPDEGVVLREAGVDSNIMVMNPGHNSFATIIKHDLEPEIYSFDILQSLIHYCEHNNEKTPKVHLKFDTGMHRLGFSSEDLDQIIAICQEKNVVIASILSHLATADDTADHSFALTQISIFDEIKNRSSSLLEYQPLYHLLNSAGILQFPEYQYDMVRLGIGLYGVSPVSESAYLSALYPASSFTAVVAQINHIKKGDSVGYGKAYIAANDTTIATISVGYADGLRRSLGNGKGKVHIAGKSVPIVGNVCMDMTMIDVSNLEVEVGDRVEIFGDHISIYDFAKSMETIPYEALTGISDRVKRVFIKE